MMYGIALREKPVMFGLDKQDIDTLYNIAAGPSNDDTFEVYPIEIEAKEHESSAMGFITPEAAEHFDYDYEKSGLCDFVAAILDDMNNESADHSYTFKGINIYLDR